MTKSEITAELATVCDRLDEIRSEIALAQLDCQWGYEADLRREMQQLRERWVELVEIW